MTDPELPQAQPMEAEPEAQATSGLVGAAGLEAVARVTHEVMRHASLEDVLNGIAAGVRVELASDTATLLLLEGDVLHVHAASGVDEATAAAVCVPVGEGFAGTIAATQKPLVLPDVTPDQVHSAYLRDSARSLLGVPLLADGELVGVLHAGWRERRSPTAAELAFLELVGAPAGAAIVRARLYEAERASRRQAEAATARLKATAAATATLERVGTLLAATLDYERTLSHITDVIVPEIAEFCQIYLVDGDAIRRVGVACGRADRQEALEAVYRRPALGTRGQSPQARAIATGEPQFVPELDDAFYQRSADDAEHLALLRALAPRSLVVAPMHTHRGVSGAIAAGRFDADRPFTQDEFALIVEIARRAGMAVENARLYRELADVSEAKSQFLSTMSHELRTPLNAVIGYASLLRDQVAGPLTEVQRDHVSRILSASDHLLLLINEVLTLSRLEAGKERVDPSVFDVADVARSVGEMVGSIASRRGLHIDVAVDGPVAVRSDETKVRQILLNLLSNAIKFTDAGEVAVHVEGGEDIRIHVRDTGRGVAPADLDRIFEPFFQVSQGTTRSDGGTGLGLTVSRRLARLLGGDLNVTSRIGGGSTFTLRLPPMT